MPILARTLALVLLSGAPVGAQAPDARRAFAEPALSPDAREIVFVHAGDLWTVPTSGGEARLLVSHPAEESRPRWSPDGARLGFVSTRAGTPDVYVLTLATGAVRRLTFADGAELLDGWSRDGRTLYFSSSNGDIAGMNDVYGVPVDGGTPMPVAADRYANEHSAAESPDGGTLAITARGISDGQWWRRGSSHIDQSEIWLVRRGATPSYARVTDGGAREGWPMWSPDGSALLYVSDRGGAQNVWMRPVADGAARQLTRFADGRVLWPTIARDGRVAFERDFAIWMLDPATGESRAVPIILRGVAAADGAEHLRLTSGFDDLALSPDGRKIAFVARGELFAASAAQGGDAARLTRSVAPEMEPVWTHDSRAIIYASERDGASRLYRVEVLTGVETPLTSGEAGDHTPHLSPDGRLLAFARGGEQLVVRELASGRERIVATARLGRAPFQRERGIAWSPDGRWLAYLASGAKGFTNAYVVPAAGGESRQVSWLSNVFGGGLSWSPDGTFLLLDTRQRTEPGRLVRVDLVARTPRFREDAFRDLFTDSAPPRGGGRARSVAAVEGGARGSGDAPVRIDFEGIRHRSSIVPVGVDVGAHRLTSDGRQVLLLANDGGRTNLYLYDLDELARERPVARQLTSTPRAKSRPWFTPDDKQVLYLEGGRIQSIALDAREPKPLAVSAELDVDFAEEKRAVFEQAWRIQRDAFYDPDMHGVDWSAVRARYAPYVEGANTREELRRLLALMVGELNASHSGISSPRTGEAVVGRLGLDWDAAAYAREGALQVRTLLPLGPAAIAGVHAGDVLLAVDGAAIARETNLDSLLAHRIDRRTVLTLAQGSAGGARREVVVRPVSLEAEKALRYRDWVESRRAYVARVSNGRLGYVHMLNMSAQALEQLYLDLDAENHGREGVVIDLRNNNGGFVNAYALDVLARRPYLTLQPRGLEPSPARTQLGQRALELPTTLVVNQHSLSDAEDFTEGYRALGLGRIVGEPTAGWIIYTSSVRLVDGTGMRLPFIRVTDAAGKNMELAPRPVDVPVQRPIGESYTDRDVQLDAAVRELLGQLAAAGPRQTGR